MPIVTSSTLVRWTEPADLAALVALVERCSNATVYRRFHGAADRPIRRELGRIASSTDDHRSWVAVSPDGVVRGTATLAWGRSGAVDAAFLVEDAWFRRGVGRALFRALAAEARRSAAPAVVATIQADNERAIAFLRSVTPGSQPVHVGGAEVEVTIPVVPAPPVVPAAPARAVPAFAHAAAAARQARTEAA